MYRWKLDLGAVQIHREVALRSIHGRERMQYGLHIVNQI